MDYIAKVKDLTGRKFGKWTAIECIGRNANGNAVWLCECECGTIRGVSSGSLLRNISKSCGCTRAEAAAEASRKVTTKHGGRKERLYSVWRGIKDRCENTKSVYYEHYGGRGIYLCDEWHDYAVFRDWAKRSGYDEKAPKYKCTIDRIDNDGGYCPENCRWVPQIVQCNNRSSNHMITFKNQTKTISEWAREVKISKSAIRARIFKYGWPVERALTEPIHNKKNNNTLLNTNGYRHRLCRV